ncbi:MAG: sigma-70 factor domain-containing protein, partial [Pirellulales bacterium]
MSRLSSETSGRRGAERLAGAPVKKRRGNGGKRGASWESSDEAGQWHGTQADATDATHDVVEEDHGDRESGSPTIDDPVRMYLMQMGEIPMMSRDQEIDAAKQIER